jgi:hypothetical protein
VSLYTDISSLVDYLWPMSMTDFKYVCISKERWWKDTYRRKPQFSEINLSHCHLAHHKSHMDWPGIELRALKCEADD